MAAVVFRPNIYGRFGSDIKLFENVLCQVWRKPGTDLPLIGATYELNMNAQDRYWASCIPHLVRILKPDLR